MKLLFEFKSRSITLNAMQNAREINAFFLLYFMVLNCIYVSINCTITKTIKIISAGYNLFAYNNLGITDKISSKYRNLDFIKFHNFNILFICKLFSYFNLYGLAQANSNKLIMLLVYILIYTLYRGLAWIGSSSKG
ncbi:membrane hypothetical protein [Clostridiaceae bacterium BL-3]|nr:membrane hypothetical protein [Clostridiaceae bacterium BL-3]